MIGIYKITSPSGRVYIGQSVDIEKRHSNYRLGNCTNQIKVYNSIKKYGFENHKFEVLKECELIELNENERHYQDLYNVLEFGLNCVLTKTHDKSGYVSNESRIKMSENRKGTSSRLGAKLTEKTKDKIKLKAIGRKASTDTKNKMSNMRKGIPQSKQLKEKRALSQTKIVLDINTGIFYFGLKEISNLFNIKLSTLGDRMRNKVDYNFKYV